ncbi:hypothetical protein BDD12DRAFT_839822 [Trichophaea hybrida]|nr:hypothetical protein BDD12DRAFT_839822 [Trichophaea hybrida]
MYNTLDPFSCHQENVHPVRLQRQDEREGIGNASDRISTAIMIMIMIISYHVVCLSCFTSAAAGLSYTNHRVTLDMPTHHTSASGVFLLCPSVCLLFSFNQLAPAQPIRKKIGGFFYIHLVICAIKKKLLETEER